LLDFILLGVGALNLVQDPEFGLTEIGPNGTLSEILVDEPNKTDYAIAQLSTAVVGLVAALCTCCVCLSQPADVRRRFAAGLLWCLYAAPGLSWLGIVGWQSATLAQDWSKYDKLGWQIYTCCCVVAEFFAGFAHLLLLYALCKDGGGGGGGGRRCRTGLSGTNYGNNAFAYGQEPTSDRQASKFFDSGLQV